MAESIAYIKCNCNTINKIDLNRLNEKIKCGNCGTELDISKIYSSAPIELNDKNFDIIISKSISPVLVDFWAEWCGPCHFIAPAVSEIAKQYKGKVLVGKVNVDFYPHLAGRYGINAIPTLIIFLGGNPVENIIGAVPKRNIESALKKYLISN